MNYCFLEIKSGQLSERLHSNDAVFSVCILFNRMMLNVIGRAVRFLLWTKVDLESA